MTLIASHCHSLKEKRQVVRKLKDRVRARFQIPVSEVASQDMWQRVVLGFAVVAGERHKADGLLGDVAGYMASLSDREGLATLAGDEREIFAYGDDIIGDVQGVAVATQDNQDDSWVPEAWKAELDD